MLGGKAFKVDFKRMYFQCSRVFLNFTFTFIHFSLCLNKSGISVVLIAIQRF